MFSLLRDKKFLHATAVLIGTMVGVGVFGIPFAFAKAGFWIGFLFLALIALLTLFTDFIYGEIILRTHRPHQLVGYTELYLGNIWKKIMFFSIILSTYAALLAYVIIAGEFLTNILSPYYFVSSTVFSFWFFAISSIFIFLGLRTVAWVELGITVLFVIVIGLIFIFGFSKIDLSNYSVVNPEMWFFPYGVMLFAFAGLMGVPIQRQILAGEENKLKRSIITALVIVSILYFLFAFTVFGISGEATSPDAISGLIDLLGGRIIFLGSLFGVLAVTTSYIMLGTGLLQIFTLDYGFGKKFSWALVVIPPLILFVGGLRNFIDVIGLAGGAGIGLEVFILIWIYVRAKSHGDRLPEYSMAVPVWSLYLLALIFAGGIFYTFITR